MAFQAVALPFHNTTAEEAAWGESSSFRQLLTEYRLAARDQAMVRVAAIVQDAEESGPTPEPEAARLVASLRDVKARVPGDAEVVAPVRPVLDARYAACRVSPG